MDHVKILKCCQRLQHEPTIYERMCKRQEYKNKNSLIILKGKENYIIFTPVARNYLVSRHS